MSKAHEGDWFAIPRVVDPHELGTVMVDCFNSVPDHLIAQLADVFEQVAEWYAHTTNMKRPSGTLSRANYWDEIARYELGDATWFLGFSVSPDSLVYKATSTNANDKDEQE